MSPTLGRTKSLDIVKSCFFNTNTLKVLKGSAVWFTPHLPLQSSLGRNNWNRCDAGCKSRLWTGQLYVYQRQHSVVYPLQETTGACWQQTPLSYLPSQAPPTSLRPKPCRLNQYPFPDSDSLTHVNRCQCSGNKAQACEAWRSWKKKRSGWVSHTWSSCTFAARTHHLRVIADC